MVGPLLAPLIERLAPAIIVHRLWEAGDRDAFLREHAHVRLVITDALAGADRRLIEALPELELIASFGVGCDTIAVDAARARGVRVTNTPGVLDDDVADLAMALLLAVARRLVDADRFVRAGRWPEQRMFPLARRVSGKRLGILGLGRIGKVLARRAAGFDMRIAYHGRRAQPDQPYTYYADLLALARDSDFLVVLVPETAATRGLVGREVLAALGPEGVLINVGRGAVVDETALVELLAAGHLGGAGLDVYAHEPQVPETLLGMDNVVLLPHIGSGTVETRAAMAELLLRNVQAWLAGKPPPTPVD